LTLGDGGKPGGSFPKQANLKSKAEERKGGGEDE
jgi:hypothetical protein